MAYDIDPNMAANAAAQQDLSARRREVESLVHTGSPAEKQARLRSACEGFEAVFIQKMWEQMRASLPKEGLMKGKEEEYWQSMYDQELGKSMASAGGIGLADMMMVQLTRNDQAMSDAAKGSAMRRPTLNVSPAPLLPPSANVEHRVNSPVQTAEQMATPSPAAQTAPAPADPMSIYDGEASPEAPLTPDNSANSPANIPANGSVADDTPASVRQTLDELSRQLGVPATAAATTPADPVVTHITYQTNLPPSQRKASPAKQQSGAIQPRPLNTAPAAMPGAASAISPANFAASVGNVEGYVPAAPANTPAPQAAPAARTAPAAPKANDFVQTALRDEPQDILAGIKPRFVPSRFLAQNTRAADAGMEAMRVSRAGDGRKADIVSQTGGPALSGPEEVAAPVAMGNPEPPRGSLSAPVAGELSSGFGWRIDPFTGQRAWHAGVDIKAQPGESVKAAMDGVVTFAGPHPELGNLVVVEHSDGLRTFYGHNQNLEVAAGQRVTSGTELAQAGSSGRAAGPHVHFEVRRGELALNPEPLLRQQHLQVAEAN